ncbi:MAG: alkaline phosphatase D family protein, partial [Planctomycetes bacterium]|nr:alkaline phosphatase D family protein [Planctomycetota bacterium]
MRRETLAALFLAAAAGIVIAQASLTQGPVVGGVTEAGAVVWIRTSASASVSVAFSITPDLAGAQVVVGVTDAAKDSTALIPLTGLSPSTTYYYNVLVEGAPVFSADFPRFRTFPAPGSDTEVSFAFGSCQSDGNHPIFSSIAAKDPLFFLQNGDFGYPDAMDPSTKLERQRQNFRAQYDPAHPLAGVLLRTAPLVYVWDDHDYGGNNSDKNQPGKEYSLQAYRDYVPGYPLAQDAIGVWHSFRAGNAEFFALDCRSQRDPELTSWNDRLNPDRSMLNGTDLPATQSQWDWLLGALLGSTARWKFIVQSVVWNPTFSSGGGDSWAGYLIEQQALID